MTRTEILKNLIFYSQPLDSTKSLLETFGWNSDEDLVILTADHITRILEQFLNGRIDAQQVEDWANAIEGREDIGFESETHDVVQEVVFELANPLLTQALTPARAEYWIGRLRVAS